MAYVCKVCGETDQRTLDACAYEIGGMGPRCEWLEVTADATHQSVRRDQQLSQEDLI